MQKNENALTPEQLREYRGIVDEMEKLRTLTLEEKENMITAIMSRPFMDLTCDWAFKHLMSRPENLRLLLNDILPEEVGEIEYDPNELIRMSPEDKNVIMDVLCHSKEDPSRTFIVEMQRQDKTAFKNRMFYYGAAHIRNQLSGSESYHLLHPVYIICLMNFTTIHQADKLVYVYQMREKESGELYGNLLSIYMCELPRIKKNRLSEMSSLEQTLFIIRNIHIFASVPEDLDPRYTQWFKDARTIELQTREKQQYLRAMLTDYEKNDIATAYLERGRIEGREEGREEGRAEGRAQGEIEGRKAVARGLLELGVDIRLISASSGLSEEELKDLIKN
ncbi:MAG: Rpn family recombination-promoting nuclease/putative transposase [Bacteroidales bacterium]|nr:Rpn family recombination-promoting nuclease/putative transposase [Bacteroidales bacterium]